MILSVTITPKCPKTALTDLTQASDGFILFVF